MLDRKKFFESVRASLFNGRLNQSQVDGMNAIIDAFIQYGDARIKTLAYALATAYHEVGGRMVPVREGFASSDLRARQIVERRKYGKPAGPYNHVYYGRGYVQLTWLDNYKRSSEDAGVDLVRYPDKALDPEIGAKLLIKGLIDGRWNGRGKGIAFYLTDGRDDLKNARRTVNITDKWKMIGGYYTKFLKALRESGGIPTKRNLKKIGPEIDVNEVTPSTKKPPVNPKPLKNSRIMKGSALAGVGALGQTVQEGASQISFLADYGQIFRILFVALLITGIGLVIYARWDDSREHEK